METKNYVAYSILTLEKAENGDAEKRVLRGVASTPTLDRNGDVIVSEGISFKNPTVLLWQHDRMLPVGTVVFEKPTKKGIRFTATLPTVTEAGTLKDRVDEAWQSVKYGLIWGVSVGIRAMLDDVDQHEDGGMIIKKSEISELSLVTIPANADARIDSIKALDQALRAASGQPIPNKPAVAEKKPINLKKSEKSTMKTIAEQREAFEVRRAANEARMDELLKLCGEESRGLVEAEKTEYDDLDAENDEIDEHLTRLRKVEARKQASAAPVNGTDSRKASDSRGAPLVIQQDKRLANGVGFAQYAMCLAAARGNKMHALEMAKTHYSGNEGAIELLKAAVAGGTTTDPTWASPLVNEPTRLTSEFIEFLRPQTILGKFGTDGIPSLRRVPFNISIPAQTSGGEGYWVGEGAPKPLTNFDWASIILRWAKVANIAVLTQELIRFSNPSAEMLVRDELAAALRARMDIDFIDPAKAAVADVSPASITNGATSVPSGSPDVGPADADTVRADVAKLFQAYINANATPSSGVWIMNATTALALSMKQNALGQAEFPGITMNGGTFFGLPVIVSQYLPVTPGDPVGPPITSDSTIVILANASDILLADDGGVTIDISNEASLQMDNAPTNNSAVPTATSLVSMFQTNSVAIRAERFINWARRRATAVAYLTGVRWA